MGLHNGHCTSTSGGGEDWSIEFVHRTTRTEGRPVPIPSPSRMGKGGVKRRLDLERRGMEGVEDVEGGQREEGEP